MPGLCVVIKFGRGSDLNKYSIRMAWFWASVILLWFQTTITASAQEAADRMDNLTRQWLDLERQTSHMQSNWREQHPLLMQRITLLKAEREQLEGILQESQSSQTHVDAQRSSLLAEQARFEQQQEQVSIAIEELRTRLKSIKSQLPPPLRETWAAEQQELGDTPETSMELQVALAQLSLLAEFNQRISVNESLITTPDGRDIQVKQLYLGVGMAWFTSANAEISGWGQSDETGWHWYFEDKVDPTAINTAIAMFEKRQQAEFVRLPIVLHSVSQLEGDQP